jgi:hypothetical protein
VRKRRLGSVAVKGSEENPIQPTADNPPTTAADVSSVLDKEEYSPAAADAVAGLLQEKFVFGKGAVLLMKFRCILNSFHLEVIAGGDS